MGMFLLTLFLLLAGHAYADFNQGDFMAINKSHKHNPQNWYWLLFGHAFIHGAIVFAVIAGIEYVYEGHAALALYAQQIFVIALGEVIVHAASDIAKCDERISFRADQAVHIFSKVLWALVAVLFVF